MKRSLIFLLLAALSLSLCACAESPAPAASIPETAPETLPVFASLPAEALMTEPVAVYEGAVEDYLLPLERYSSERTENPRFVMIHFTSNVVADRDDPYDMDAIRSIFTDYEVSIHYIIDREGTVRCYIPEDRIAWHAGKGEWAGDPSYTNRMNHYAIGIELAAIGSQSDMATYLTAAEYDALDDSLIGFTDAQYDALSVLVEDICSRYQIPMDRAHIIGHEEYSPQKQDPGQLFDWSRITPEAVG